jgi:hypothetical protein
MCHAAGTHVAGILMSDISSLISHPRSCRCHVSWLIMTYLADHHGITPFAQASAWGAIVVVTVHIIPPSRPMPVSHSARQVERAIDRSHSPLSPWHLFPDVHGKPVQMSSARQKGGCGCCRYSYSRVAQCPCVRRRATAAAAAADTFQGVAAQASDCSLLCRHTHTRTHTHAHTQNLPPNHTHSAPPPRCPPAAAAATPAGVGPRSRAETATRPRTVLPPRPPRRRCLHRRLARARPGGGPRLSPPQWPPPPPPPPRRTWSATSPGRRTAARPAWADAVTVPPPALNDQQSRPRLPTAHVLHREIPGTSRQSGGGLMVRAGGQGQRTAARTRTSGPRHPPLPPPPPSFRYHFLPAASAATSASGHESAGHMATAAPPSRQILTHTCTRALHAPPRHLFQSMPCPGVWSRACAHRRRQAACAWARRAAQWPPAAVTGGHVCRSLARAPPPTGAGGDGGMGLIIIITG